MRQLENKLLINKKPKICTFVFPFEDFSISIQMVIVLILLRNNSIFQEIIVSRNCANLTQVIWIFQKV